MRKRGRPPTQDILTPREWEVLDLLRDGLSNREIAERLEISLSGAKYHVSEVISKLGVASREEAADWRPDVSKRWGFAPAAVLGRSGGLSLGLVAKLAGGGVTVAALVFVVFALGGDSGAGSGPDALAAGGPTPTPELPCPTPADSEQPIICVRILHTQLASWDEAFTLAPGRILEPAYVPPATNGTASASPTAIRHRRRSGGRPQWSRPSSSTVTTSF